MATGRERAQSERFREHNAGFVDALLKMQLTSFLAEAIPGAVLTASKPLVACLPGLVEAIDLIGSSQIQGRASLGGNLCNASPAGDTIAALVANAGVCVIVAAGGQREMPVEAFVVGVGKNALKPGEYKFYDELKDTKSHGKIVAK